MPWTIVGREVIDAWVQQEPDDEIRIAVLTWILGFVDGPGFADAVPSLTQADLFVARVPGTSVIVTFLRLALLDPPAVAIRAID